MLPDIEGVRGIRYVDSIEENPNTTWRRLDSGWAIFDKTAGKLGQTVVNQQKLSSRTEFKSEPCSHFGGMRVILSLVHNRSKYLLSAYFGVRRISRLVCTDIFIRSIE